MCIHIAEAFDSAPAKVIQSCPFVHALSSDVVNTLSLVEFVISCQTVRRSSNGEHEFSSRISAKGFLQSSVTKGKRLSFVAGSKSQEVNSKMTPGQNKCVCVCVCVCRNHHTFVVKILFLIVKPALLCSANA